MKAIYTLLCWTSIITIGFGQLTITEISYNPPESGTDSLEYIEVLNTSGASLDLTGWTFTQGVEGTLSTVLAADEYLLIAVNPSAMMLSLIHI